MITKVFGKLPVLASLAAFAMAAVGSSNWANEVNAEMVGWSFQRDAPALLADEVAGAPGYTQGNWNNHPGFGQAPGTVPFNNLVDSSGNATTISLTAWTQSANNSWSYTGPPTTPDEKLGLDFANQQASLTFTGIGGDYVTYGYSVVVYYGNNEGPTTATLTVTGSNDDLVSNPFQTGNTEQAYVGNVGWLQQTVGQSASTVTNYIVFEGLNDPGFTLAMTGGGNNGIMAVQIVGNPIPEPSSMLMLGAGAAGLAFVRRRRVR